MAMMKWSLATKGEKLEAAIMVNGHWLQKERNQVWDHASANVHWLQKK